MLDRTDTRPTRREIARALGLADDCIRRLALLGMRTTSVDAGRARRAQHKANAASRDALGRAAARANERA